MSRAPGYFRRGAKRRRAAALPDAGARNPTPGETKSLPDSRGATPEISPAQRAG